MRGERTGTLAKPEGGNGNHLCQHSKKTIMKQGDIIPIIAIYFHIRFLLASITICFIISCIVILTDDKIYVVRLTLRIIFSFASTINDWRLVRELSFVVFFKWPPRTPSFVVFNSLFIVYFVFL